MRKDDLFKPEPAIFQPEGDESQANLVRQKIKSTQDKQKRFKIIKALAKVQAPWAHEIMLDCLEDPYEILREFIINELAQKENLDLEMVYQKLSSLHWYVRSSSLKILGLKKAPEMAKRIAFMLNESNADVRMNIAWALGEIGGKEAIAHLARLAKDPNNFVKTSAEKALKKASDLRFS